MTQTTARRDDRPVVVIGAGPAGLTAAYQLGKAGRAAVVLEADDVVGGISRTVERDGWRFDIGGHRFFTKVQPVEELWHEILAADEFLLRSRMSRMFYDGKFYDYPLKPLAAVRNLGLVEAIRCGLSFLKVRGLHPEGQELARGLHRRQLRPTALRALLQDVQRKGMGCSGHGDLGGLGCPAHQGHVVVQGGVGAGADQGWRGAAQSCQAGDEPDRGVPVPELRARDDVGDVSATWSRRPAPMSTWRRPWWPSSATGDGARAVVFEEHGARHRVEAGHVVSSMPISELVETMDPPAPDEVRAAAAALHYRDFLTVALVVPEDAGFPDNWIYIHSPTVQVGRIQNFGAWSPFMVQPGTTCLGLEYFVFEGDELWSADDDVLIDLASGELAAIGLVPRDAVVRGYVVRMPKAYPVYDDTYLESVDVIRRWLRAEVPNVHPVGRNGMHKYNNQDHSMYTAMLTVENIVDGTAHDIWAVNVDEEYHEERSGTDGESGTGRDAPVLPRRVAAVTGSGTT